MKKEDLDSFGVYELDLRVSEEVNGGAPAGTIMDKDSRDWWVGFAKGFVKQFFNLG